MRTVAIIGKNHEEKNKELIGLLNACHIDVIISTVKPNRNVAIAAVDPRSQSSMLDAEEKARGMFRHEIKELKKKLRHTIDNL